MFFLMDIQVAEYLFSAAASEESQNSPIELTISVSFIGYIFVLAGLSFNLRFWSDRNGKREVVLVNAKEGIIKIKNSNEFSLLFLTIFHALS
jgi:hypothetical protein